MIVEIPYGELRRHQVEIIAGEERKAKRRIIARVQEENGEIINMGKGRFEIRTEYSIEQERWFSVMLSTSVPIKYFYHKEYEVNQ